MKRINLLRLPGIRPLFTSRFLQLLSRSITLAGFLFVILAGLFGSVVGSHNFAIIFVWIAWWTALKLFFIPFGGRSWCALCPIPVPGEWLQRGALLGPQGKGLDMGRRWPRWLHGAWPQVGLFGMMGLFSAVILTQPRVTAWVLLGLIALSAVLSTVFERRAFCTHLCPIGAFTAQYSRMAPVEVRVIDSKICSSHGTKTCFTGSQQAYGCPWGNFPGALHENTNCGLCMECLRACPYDNLAVNLRAFTAEVRQPTAPRLDEAALGLVMLASALVYAAIFLGPWGWLKLAAYSVGSLPWAIYSVGFVGFVLGLVPGAFLTVVAIGRRLSSVKASLRRCVGLLSQALLPLGLATWIAFTIAFAFAKLSYVLPVISDPLGWGWHLLGNVPQGGTAYLMNIVPGLQILVVAGGLLWSVHLAQRYARLLTPSSPTRLALPVVLFSLVFSLGLLGMLVS